MATESNRIGYPYLGGKKLKSLRKNLRLLTPAVAHCNLLKGFAPSPGGGRGYFYPAGPVGSVKLRQAL